MSRVDADLEFSHSTSAGLDNAKMMFCHYAVPWPGISFPNLNLLKYIGALNLAVRRALAELPYYAIYHIFGTNWRWSSNYRARIDAVQKVQKQEAWTTEKEQMPWVSDTRTTPIYPFPALLSCEGLYYCIPASTY